MSNKLDISKFKNEMNNFLDKLRNNQDLDDPICSDKFIVQVSKYIDKNDEINLNISSYYETTKGLNKTCHQLIKISDVNF